MFNSLFLMHVKNVTVGGTSPFFHKRVTFSEYSNLDLYLDLYLNLDLDLDSHLDLNLNFGSH